MSDDKPQKTLQLKPRPVTDKPADRARAPVRPRGPARARPLSEVQAERAERETAWAARRPVEDSAERRPRNRPEGRSDDRFGNRDDGRRPPAPGRSANAGDPRPARTPQAARPSRPIGDSAERRPGNRPEGRSDDRFGNRPEGRSDDRFGNRAEGRRPSAPARPTNAGDPRPARAPQAARPSRAASPNAPRTPSRQPASSVEGTRLNKRLAELGLCSRREGDDWIERGWVKVNGQKAQMGQTVTEADQVGVLPAARQQQDSLVTILLHKPVGFVSGQPEDGHETAAVLVQPRNQWRTDPFIHQGPRWATHHARNLAPAGRLDIDSTGLLVLTQDGRVARTLIGEDSSVDKEYLVRVQWAPDGPNAPGVVSENVEAVVPPDCIARLRHGLSLDDQPLKPAQVEWQNPEQLRFVLNEGKKRQIRRMCEQVGLHVVGLKRIRMGRIVLGNLPVGQWRYLRANERF